MPDLICTTSNALFPYWILPRTLSQSACDVYIALVTLMSTCTMYKVANFVLPWENVCWGPIRTLFRYSVIFLNLSKPTCHTRFSLVQCIAKTSRATYQKPGYTILNLTLHEHSTSLFILTRCVTPVLRFNLSHPDGWRRTTAGDGQEDGRRLPAAHPTLQNWRQRHDDNVLRRRRCKRRQGRRQSKEKQTEWIDDFRECTMTWKIVLDLLCFIFNPTDKSCPWML